MHINRAYKAFLVKGVEENKECSFISKKKKILNYTRRPIQCKTNVQASPLPIPSSKIVTETD